MTIFSWNGTPVTTVTFNGTSVSNVYMNGTLVWSSAPSGPMGMFFGGYNGSTVNNTVTRIDSSG